MDIPITESLAILEQFKAQRAASLPPATYHSIHVLADPELYIEVSITHERDEEKSSLIKDCCGETFIAQIGDERIEIPVTIRVSDLYEAHVSNPSTRQLPVRAGDSAKGDDLRGTGTLGWMVFLDNALVGISNWHVLCSNGNDTALNSSVSFNGENVARLYLFEPVNAVNNIWDYALGRFDQLTDAIDEMRKCESGSQFDYPLELSEPSTVQIGKSETYYKVGNKAPICREGKLIGAGDARVDYKNGFVAHFKSQLIFSKMTDAGDSGAAIVRKSDNTVTGLNFAGSDQRTVANPLYLVNWSRQGVFETVRGCRFPVFQSSKSTFMLSNNDPFNASISSTPNFPRFDQGKLFLGVAIQTQPAFPSAAEWVVPIPPKARPNVDVETVFLRQANYWYPTPGRNPVLANYFLCFG